MGPAGASTPSPREASGTAIAARAAPRVMSWVPTACMPMSPNEGRRHAPDEPNITANSLTEVGRESYPPNEGMEPITAGEV